MDSRSQSLMGYRGFLELTSGLQSQNSLDLTTSKYLPESGIQITANWTIVFLIFAFETSQYDILRVHNYYLLLCVIK